METHLEKGNETTMTYFKPSEYLMTKIQGSDFDIAKFWTLKNKNQDFASMAGGKNC